jgi:hypothetical protein
MEPSTKTDICWRCGSSRLKMSALICGRLSKQLDCRSDLLASADYRRSLATALTRKAMTASIEKARASV